MRVIDADKLPVKGWKKRAAMLQDDYTAGAGTDWVLKVAMAENKMLWEIISAIENAPTLAQPNEPLTLEQLREMDGEPVWVEMKIFHKLTGWAIVHVDSDMEAIRLWRKCGNWIQFAADEMEVYAYQPAHIDREAWDECEYCAEEDK